MIIRVAIPGDAATIRNILRAAFGGDQEANLIDNLRNAGDLLLSLVAEDAGQIVGYLGFSRLWIACEAQRSAGSSLAPLAVAVDRRRRGIGAALVEAGHQRLRSAGESIVFVLGDPAYYRRFGYLTQAAAKFECVYAGPHFQALALADDAPRTGAIAYAAAFDQLH